VKEEQEEEEERVAAGSKAECETLLQPLLHLSAVHSNPAAVFSWRAAAPEIFGADPIIVCVYSKHRSYSVQQAASAGVSGQTR